MIASYVFLQEGNIAEGEQRINLAIRHALQRCELGTHILQNCAFTVCLGQLP